MLHMGLGLEKWILLYNVQAKSQSAYFYGSEEMFTKQSFVVCKKKMR